MKKPDVRGLTLIEVLVVMTLIGLLAGIVGPAVANRLDSLSLQNAATELIGQFRRAQAVARAGQSPVVAVYADRGFTFLNRNKTIATFRLPSSISLAATTPLLFLPSGQVVGPDHFDLQNARGKGVVITIDFLAGMLVTNRGAR